MNFDTIIVDEVPDIQLPSITVTLELEDEEVPDIKLPSITVSLDSEQQEEPICVKDPTEIILGEEESEGCVSSQCTIHNACPDEKGFFSIENLFSELTSDYLRAIIRQNLGIGDSQAILWGNIEGNLTNLEDLYKFVKDIAQVDADKIIGTLNLKLEYWANHIESKIESRASNIITLQLRPMYASTMEVPVDVLVSWEYANEVEELKINGYQILPTTRNFLIQNVVETKDITLSYKLDGLWLSRTITFIVHSPTFFGTSPNFEECNLTISDKFKVNANEDEYIYVLTSVPSDLSVNGFIGGFSNEGSTYIHERLYYTYKSVNKGLGQTTITRYDSE